MIVSPLPVDQEDVAARYDALARFLPEVWGEHVHHGLFHTGTEPPALAQKNLVVKVAEAAGARPGLKVVDVGCGTGAAARMLARDYGCEVTGFTLSAAEAARAAAVATKPNPRIIHGDFLANDLQDDAFDAVVLIESSEHFADRARLFAEANRVLRPGGRCVVASLLACDRPWAWEKARLLEPLCAEGRIPALLDEREQKRALWDASFDVGPLQDLTTQVAQTWPAMLRAALARRGDVDAGFWKATARLWAAETLRTVRYGVVVATKRPAKK